MTTPEDGDSAPPVGFSKGDPAADAPFDPYRFGKPDRPIPPEYAPPGYVPPAPEVSSPYAATSPYGTSPQHPYGGPPSSYGPPEQQRYGAPPPYGQYPGGYGAPPPPGYHGYAQPRTGNGKAVASLVLGILSIIFCWLSIFDGIFVILALIFGLIALSESRSRPDRSGRGIAIGGLVCCVIGAVLATVITVKYVHAINACGGYHTGTVFEQCLQDNL